MSNQVSISTRRDSYDEGSYVVTRTVRREDGALVMEREWTIVRSRLVVSSGYGWVVKQRGFRKTAVVNTLKEGKELVLAGRLG